MAIDVQFVLHLPMAAAAEIPQSLYKVLSLPKAPTISEDVWIHGDTYFTVNRVRYREDGRVEEHFTDQTLFDWSVDGALASYEVLQAGGWSDASPWNVPDEAEPETPPVDPDPDPVSDPEPTPDPQPDPEPEPEPEPEPQP